MTNLDIWEKVRSVPPNAQKSIGGGRLKGMTDINPMWRIKVLTENFGKCGFGWKYEILEKRLETVESGEVAAFVDILLYIKENDVWSDGIPGTGGSMFVAKEKNGLYTSDECYKMALTDAISVACKSLGVGADIYWDEDSTKYDKSTPKPQQTKNEPAQAAKTGENVCLVCGVAIPPAVSTFSLKKYGKPLCVKCQKNN